MIICNNKLQILISILNDERLIDVKNQKTNSSIQLYGFRQEQMESWFSTAAKAPTCEIEIQVQV
jgi:hypothetical protein